MGVVLSEGSAALRVDFVVYHPVLHEAGPRQSDVFQEEFTEGENPFEDSVVGCRRIRVPVDYQLLGWYTSS
jgi:hypothetical protein